MDVIDVDSDSDSEEGPKRRLPEIISVDSDSESEGPKRRRFDLPVINVDSESPKRSKKQKRDLPKTKTKRRYPVLPVAPVEIVDLKTLAIGIFVHGRILSEMVLGHEWNIVHL